MARRSFVFLLVKSRGYFGLVGLIVIIFYLIYIGILRLGIISPFGEEASFSIITKIINFTFFLAATSIILSIISYILSIILPEKLLSPLNAEASASVIIRIIGLGFGLAVTVTIFSALSYVLPKVLPPSFFEPIPKVEYAIAIAKMFDPIEQEGMAAVMDQLEIYPGFPYYSRESDHPASWPLRVTRDRQELFSQYEAFLDSYPSLKSLFKESSNKIQILGDSYEPGERAKVELIMALRYWFNYDLKRNKVALAEQIGKEPASDFLRIESNRDKIRRQFPNRLALIRINNVGKRDANNVTLEFDLIGSLYDFAVNEDTLQVHHIEYDRAKHRITIDRILPSYQIDIRLWYTYYSVENRVFPDKMDFILELTQGIIINNVAVSQGIATSNDKLIENFSTYALLYRGNAAKKDDYSSDLERYFDKQSKKLTEHLRQDNEDHPSFKNVSPEWLNESKRTDESVNAIWISFASKSGMLYKAIHVFHNPSGPYVLLCSTSKDKEDFLRVENLLSTNYKGTAENKISDRGDDICDVISVTSGFTQKGISEQVEGFFRKLFNNVAIEAVHF